uniref:Uncharacterized protein n=1 Tax=Avena sativa TaxID=4498 RepID=A0ACD6ARD8_AVESA
MLDESQLVDKLRGLLENKRYFIVIDDICDIKSWETITSSLTCDSGGSIIIATTRVFDVATKADDVYKLEPLPRENSERLLYKRLFVGKDNCPSDQPSELKCLLTSVSLVGVLDWVRNLTSLEELSFGNVSECPNFMEDLGKLTELRKLSIMFQGSPSRVLAESLCKLEKIQVMNLRGGFGRSSTGCSWDGYVPPRGLRDLRIKVWSSRLPPWINSSLLPGLTHLKALQDGPPLKFPPGAMPCLESLQFRVHLVCLRDAGFDFDELSSLENLHCLEKVSVYIYSMEAHERDFVKADAALRHGVRIHVNHPVLEIDCDYEYDEDSDDDGSDPDDETDQEEVK